MNVQLAWGSVLGQLQMEMPRASFDTWVRDTEALSFEEDVLTVATRTAYARDWLESRLTSTVQRLLIGILNQSISVQFVVRDVAEDDPETEEDQEQDVAIEAVGWLDYDRVVQPHKQVVVKGYLRRLGAEIGPKAVWLYIGFHQAAWRALRVHANGKESGLALHSNDIRRFSGLSFGAFWRTLRNEKTRSDLHGLAQRIDPPQERRYHRGRDGRPHRRPVRYQVHMTPRLTRADATAVHARVKSLLDQGNPLSDTLQQLLAVEDVMELLLPVESDPITVPCNTVMDIARLEAGEKFSADIDRLAQVLHRRIVGCLGDIHITHYFITETIQRHNLTPAQAWLITVARDMAYLNSRTGERREVVTFKRGYEEMAELVGSKRYKTVQAWLMRDWTTQQRGGDLKRFLLEVEPNGGKSYSDLRIDTMPRAFRVLLDEPLDANGSNNVDTVGRNTVDADGSNSRAQMEALPGANGSNMIDAGGSALSSCKHSLNTNKNNTSTTWHACGEETAGAVAPDFWELETLLEQNDVHPRVQKELLEIQASVHAFVSWVLYVASPQSGRLSDPLGYAISRLREHAQREARGVFRNFASLPPAELLMLIDSTPSQAYELPKQINHPLAQIWKKTMGSNNSSLSNVRVILFGEGENQ